MLLPNYLFSIIMISIARSILAAMGRSLKPELIQLIHGTRFGKLRFKSELEQQLWSECGRLIANCILYYNASILSNVLTHRESIGDVQGVEVLKQISPVAWQHINLYGRYEFRK